MTSVKSMQLLSVLRRPAEFVDRLMIIADSRLEPALRSDPEYTPAVTEVGWEQIGDKIGDLSVFLSEPAFLEISGKVKKNAELMPANAPFAASHNGDPNLGRLCYGVVRAVRPALVVETGVCYGTTSAHILQALKQNQNGRLHSVDLPPLGNRADDFVGSMIPDELCSRWTLHRGSSRKLLPPLLHEIGRIDVFVHDSLHTYRNMSREFALAWGALRPGGVLISDDIEGNDAFKNLSALPDVAVSVVIKSECKDSLLGVVVKKQ
jgi:hypothetical protein